MRKRILAINPSPETLFLLKFTCAQYTPITKNISDNDHILELCKKHGCNLFIHSSETIKLGRAYGEITDIMEIKMLSCDKKDCVIGARYYMVFEEMNSLALDFFGISAKTVADVKYCLVFSNKFIKIYDLYGNVVFNMQFEVVAMQLMEVKSHAKEKNVETREYDKIGKIYVPMQDLKAIRVKKGHKINQKSKGLNK